MIELKIPIKLISEANNVVHWTKKRKRKIAQAWQVRAAWMNHKPTIIKLPAKVTLTRFSPRKFDDDNLVGAFKFVRDTIADLINPGKTPGHADNLKNMKFEYFQQYAKEHFIIIKIEEM